MIGMLRGRVLHKQPPSLLIDVNGVGYEVEAPMSTFFALPLNDEPVTLHTHLAIREDAHVLYGFASASDRQMFRALIKVNGVGGKVALAILSGMSPEEISLTVQSGDVKALTRVPGIGKKIAERLIVEMRDRIAKLDVSSDGASISPAAVGGASSALDDAISALLALGYKLADAQRMTKGIATEGLATEEIIRQALQNG